MGLTVTELDPQNEPLGEVYHENAAKASELPRLTRVGGALLSSKAKNASTDADPLSSRYKVPYRYLTAAGLT